MNDEHIRNKFRRRNTQRSQTAEVAALGEFLYGENWRTAVANMTHWNMLLELAAMKHLREAITMLEDARRQQGSLPEIIELRVTGHESKVASIHRRRRTWSEQTDREIKIRCVDMLRDIFEASGITVQLRDDAARPSSQD
jgi:hypothetical protein